jgi:hypothetical protein
LILPVSSEEAEASCWPGFFQKKPMKIQKIEASDTLKPGQLLATWSEWRWFGSVAFVDLQSSSRQFEFYRHRRDPVPGTKRPKRRRNFRHPKTANERRASFAAPKNREHLGDPDLAYTVRKKEALIGYRISMTMFSSSISEAGKNIGDSNARTRAVLTVRSTVLLFGREFYEEAYSAKRMELKDYPGRNCAYTSKCV